MKKIVQIPDIIIRMENLEKEFNQFKNKYLPNISNEEIKITHKNPTQNKSLSIISLDEESKSIIYNYYKIDFQLLKYDIQI
jgi:hypothetical protein